MCRDKSRFCLAVHSGHVTYVSDRGERCNPQFSIQRDVHHTVRKMIWGAIVLVADVNESLSGTL